MYKERGHIKEEYTFTHKAERGRQGGWQRRVRTKNAEDTHITIEIQGTLWDFQKIAKKVRRAARKYNSPSDKKISYDIRLLEIP